MTEGSPEAEYRLVERRYGRFERSFTLSRTVDAEKISARFEQGLLTVTLPKADGGGEATGGAPLWRERGSRTIVTAVGRQLRSAASIDGR